MALSMGASLGLDVLLETDVDMCSVRIPRSEKNDETEFSNETI